jgi:hypothetical protein
VFTLAPEKDAMAMISALTIHRQGPNLAHAPPRRISPKAPCTLSVTITMPPQPTTTGSKHERLSAASRGRLKEAKLHYRSDGEQTLDTLPLRTEDGFVYAATIPPAGLRGRWLEYAFSAVDDQGRPVRLPDAARPDVFRARLSADENPPEVAHEPIRQCMAGQDLRIAATVRDPDGVAAVRVHFRPLDESLPYDCIVLDHQGDEFSGKIPGEAIRSDFDFVYYLEAVDEAGNGCFFPDWTKTAPYVMVRTE